MGLALEWCPCLDQLTSRGLCPGGREECHTDPANLSFTLEHIMLLAIGNHDSPSNLGTLELREQHAGLGLVESGELTVFTGAKPES